MDYPWAVVGAKVVCVNNHPKPGKMWVHSDEVPVVGKVYTVAKVLISSYTGDVNFYLEELPRRGDPEPWGYAVDRFKPLEEKKLPVCLVSLLTNPNKRVAEDKFDKRGVRV